MPKQILSLVPDAPIEGIDASKFYQTPNWMATKAIQCKLTGADWTVWAFVQMLDPHGDRLKDIPNPQEIGELIGLSPKQVKRSLVKLEELGLYEIEIVKMRGRSLAGAAVKEMRTKLPDVDKVVQPGTKLSSRRQSCPKKDKSVQPETTLSDSPSETLAPRDFPSSHTITDFHKTNQTLSEGEGERNLIFWKSLDSEDKTLIRRYAQTIAIPKLPIKPTLPESWISKHCMELFNQMMNDEKFQKSSSEKCSENPPPVENQPIPTDIEYRSIANLQKIYGADWKEAAAHFGIEIKE